MQKTFLREFLPTPHQRKMDKMDKMDKKKSPAPKQNFFTLKNKKRDVESKNISLLRPKHPIFIANKQPNFREKESRYNIYIIIPSSALFFLSPLSILSHQLRLTEVHRRARKMAAERTAIGWQRGNLTFFLALVFKCEKKYLEVYNYEATYTLVSLHVEEGDSMASR